MEQFFALGDVVRLLRVQGYQISYAISTGALPEATCRIANKRCFTAEDVQRIAQHFGVEITAPLVEGDAEGGR